MKKLITMFTLVSTLICYSLTLPACNKIKNNKQTDDNNIEASDHSNTSQNKNDEEENNDFNYILNSIRSGKPFNANNYTKEQLSNFESLIKKEGFEIEYNSDDAMIVKGNESTIIQLGGKCPINKFTKLIPQPPIEEIIISEIDDKYCSVVYNIDVEGYKKYIEEIKTSNFNKDVNQEEDNSQNYYSFSAISPEGYKLNISYADNSMNIHISK